MIVDLPLTGHKIPHVYRQFTQFEKQSWTVIVIHHWHVHFANSYTPKKKHRTEITKNSNIKHGICFSVHCFGEILLLWLSRSTGVANDQKICIPLECLARGLSVAKHAMKLKLSHFIPPIDRSKKRQRCDTGVWLFPTITVIYWWPSWPCPPRRLYK